MGTIRDYYYLTKPGIIYGNLVSAIAGFFLASSLMRRLDFWLLVAMLGGLAFIIGSACVFNNYIDRDIDGLMARTKKRALVRGVIGTKPAVVYGGVLLLLGTVILAGATTVLTMCVALAGFVMYVFVYDYFKRRTVHGTLIGSISGAIPPVVGYTAVTGRLDGAALILFLILVFWQMPHFYAIALMGADDYAAASIPVLPVKHGTHTTKEQILVYTVGFTLASLALSAFGYAGYTFFGVAAMLGVTWLWLGLDGLRASNGKRWGRKMFQFSLVSLMVISVAISVGALLP